MTHLAGVIPVAQLQTDLKNVLHPVMMPIDNGYTFIQKSVYECAIAGCNTIWIVANDDVSPILRKHVGEWVYDPVYHKRTYSKFYSEKRKEIPIYYVPINPKHRDRIDSYGWSALYGCYMSWYASYKISKWIRPEKFFVSFPMSYYDMSEIRQLRRDISSTTQNFIVSHDGKTVIDNVPLSFTMSGQDFKNCRSHIQKQTSREFLPPTETEKYPSQRIPLEERWSARHFSLEQVFEKLNTKDCYTHHVEQYYDCRMWDEYKRMLSSKISWPSPPSELTAARFHAKIPHVD
jgi:hypothetical protein